MRYSTPNNGPPRILTRGMKARIIFSNPKASLGAFFILLAAIFIAVFIPFSDLHLSNPLDTNPALTTGKIEAIEETSANQNKQPVYSYTFSYVAEEKNYSAISYSSSKGALTSGDSVYVEYDATNPSFARIKNFRMAHYGVETILALVPVAILGLVLLSVALVKAEKTSHWYSTVISPPGK